MNGTAGNRYTARARHITRGSQTAGAPLSLGIFFVLDHLIRDPIAVSAIEVAEKGVVDPRPS